MLSHICHTDTMKTKLALPLKSGFWFFHLVSHLPTSPTIPQPTCPSAHPPISPSTYQHISLSAHQHINPPAHQPISPPAQLSRSQGLKKAASEFLLWKNSLRDFKFSCEDLLCFICLSVCVHACLSVCLSVYYLWGKMTNAKD